ncbi:MAG TPA: adenylate/guanylate cyclase domain-containing protein [Spirochaetaceae bacterium]|nr:adenylate/guanylate cyclase domain-containing protein [Spirochaetaceae bacterium]
MKFKKRHALIALLSAGLFSLLYLLAPFRALEWRLYDAFLWLKPERPRTDALLLLDVDDRAVEHAGVWPWPRSYVADGILRLKEFGAKALVFDIEYVDLSPGGVDLDYLRRGLPRDFQRSFGDIAANSSDLLSAVLDGQLGRQDALLYAGELDGLIAQERDDLLERTRQLARDNDLLLAQAMELYGKAWATLNLQPLPLSGEQAARKEYYARFAAPLEEAGGAQAGSYVDVLAPIPPLIKAARGAGFTNVAIDSDGVRRRIELVRKVDGLWYAQLILSPLLESLGNPELRLEARSLMLRGAALPGGERADIRIPLDARGTMLINWPKTDYKDSYAPHLSFYSLSYMDELERGLDDALLSIASSGLWLALAQDQSLAAAAIALRQAEELVDQAAAQRRIALDETELAAFDAYIEARRALREGAAAFLDSGALSGLAGGAASLASRAKAGMADGAEAIRAEAARVAAAGASLEAILKELTALRSFVADAVNGKICIIGWVGTGTTDIGVNPFYGYYINVGTHAAVADTILSRSFIKAAEPWAGVLAAFLLTPLVIIGMGRLKPGLRSAVGFGSIALTLGLSFALFAWKGLYIPSLAPALAIGAAVITRELFDYLSTEREKSFLRKAFNTYLSGDVVEEIIADPSRLKLGGASRDMTALFTDVKGFSTISEQLSPEALVALLNRYLSGMSDVILDQKGTIDKYEGDAIIAFFGAPLDLEDHALRACRSAVLMKRVETELNKLFMAEGLSPSPLATRIGLNSGNMVVGNMGTERKMNYTIMGNAVNLAARLEGVNKQYGSWILASQSSVSAAGDAIVARQMDRVRVVGIFEPVRLYEILELRQDATAELLELVERFHAGLEAFEAKDWSAAKALFKQATEIYPADGPCATYIERCDKFMKTPPLKNWDGVFNLTEK